MKAGTIRAQNSHRILTAAENEFVKHGYKGTSMQAIADAAELPKANILYYFKTKNELYRAVLEGIANRWNEALADLSEQDDPAQTLERYICSKVDLSINYPKASKIFAMEIIQGAPNLQDQLRKYLRSWVRDKVKVMQAWIAQGRMAEVDPEHLIYMIWSTTQHYADFETQVLTISNKQEYEPEDIERIKRFLCQVILTGCGLKPSPQ